LPAISQEERHAIGRPKLKRYGRLPDTPDQRDQELGDIANALDQVKGAFEKINGVKP
jgi:hypothetical protein